MSKTHKFIFDMLIGLGVMIVVVIALHIMLIGGFTAYYLLHP